MFTVSAGRGWREEEEGGGVRVCVLCLVLLSLSVYHFLLRTSSQSQPGARARGEGRCSWGVSVSFCTKRCQFVFPLFLCGRVRARRVSVAEDI